MAGIERDHRRFREHPVKNRIVNLANALRIGRVVAAEAVLVGENEIEVPAVAQRPIGNQAVDGLEIVGFDPEASVVRELLRPVVWSKGQVRGRRCRNEQVYKAEIRSISGVSC